MDIFLNNNNVSILICDRHGEEGANLQGVNALIVNYDLPFAPNRIEQRIGRLDRYGKGTKVQSFSIIHSDSIYLSRWSNCLLNTFKVFNRSIASLQYLISEQMEFILKNIINQGEEVFDEINEILGGDNGKIDVELLRIKKQDELNSLELFDIENEEFLDRMFDADSKWKVFRNAVNDWVNNALLFIKKESPDRNNILRYQYQTKTLVPQSDLIDRFLGVIDTDYKGADYRYPATYELSFNRLSAVHYKSRVARIGEPFIDAMVDYINWDDRGVSFAFWRYGENLKLMDKLLLFYRFEYKIDSGFHNELFERILKKYKMDNSVIGPIKRRGDSLFPPMMEVIWLDENLQIVNDESILNILTKPYSKPNIINEYRDYNLNFDRWAQINSILEDFIWKDSCLEAGDIALKRLYEKTDLANVLTEYADKAKIKLDRNLEQLRGRINFEKDQNKHQYDIENAISEILVEGILNPNIRNDSAGVIFLANFNPFDE